MSFLLCACGCGGALHPATSVVRYAPVRVTDATVEPVTLAEAKHHLRVEHTVDDALIASLITAARQHVEDYCEASFAAEETWQVTVDGAPPDVIALTRGPVQDVVTVHLVDQGLVEVDVDDARLDLGSQPARLYAPAAGWPAPATGASWVRTRVIYAAGAATLPGAVRQAMLLLVGQWYDARAAVVIGAMSTPLAFAVEALLASHRTTTGVVVPA